MNIRLSNVTYAQMGTQQTLECAKKPIAFTNSQL